MEVKSGESKSTVHKLVASLRMRLRWVCACDDLLRWVLIKYGLSISLHHDLDTHLKRLRDLIGSLLRISAVISGKSIIYVFNGGVGFESLGIFLQEGEEEEEEEERSVSSSSSSSLFLQSTRGVEMLQNQRGHRMKVTRESRVRTQLCKKLL